MTIGSDPEFMLADRTGKVVSAIPVIPVNKYQPLDLGDGFKVYHDNALLETNVPPASSKAQFIANIRDTYLHINKVVGGHQILALPSGFFTPEECRHPDAMEAGCSPEFCAYTIEQCFPPDLFDTFRSAGGHIHIGRDDFKDIDDEECSDDEFLIGRNAKLKMIKAMDIFVGCPLVLLDNSECSKARKRLYGKAGRFRPTAYGVEYRTPSNFWLGSPKMAGLIFDLTSAAWEAVLNKTIKIGKKTSKAFDAINNDDEATAESLCRAYLPADLCEQISTLRGNVTANINGEWGF